jgi:biotin-dependent carboxylase-like uncharacterized protein
LITITKAPPFATVQDGGRMGHRWSAVPPSGAMDLAALARANLAVGNRPHTAAIEWGIGAGQLRIPAGIAAAIGGAAVTARRDGDLFTIEDFRSGAWAYIAMAGGVDVPEVLGSRSTYLPGGFGGRSGRLLRTGDVLKTGAAKTGAVTSATAAVAVDRVPTSDPQRPIEIVAGPDRGLLDDDAWERFLGAEWTVSRAVSRAGYCLEGPVIPFEPAADLPSGPVCPGTIQLPSGGRPIVLMPDGPTVGGYPRIAVVLSRSLGRLAQRRPGESVRFAPP